MNVTAIIVSYNPDITRFKIVLSSVSKQVKHMIIVDNNSANKNLIRGLCVKLDNCELIELKFNSGVAYALKMGIRYAYTKHDPEWFLLLDDDTILLDEALNKVFNMINSLKPVLRKKIGAILLGSTDGNCDIKEITYGIFSGTLIKAEIALKSCCREEFFLDQADHDMYSRIREQGYLTISINCKLVDHKLGQKRWIKILSNISRKPLDYEPPWRYYYIVRNSTKLLLENRLDFKTYINQLRYWGIRIIFGDGIKAFIKSFGLGLIHALLNKFGYLDRRIFERNA